MPTQYRIHYTKLLQQQIDKENEEIKKSQGKGSQIHQPGIKK